MRRPMSTWLVAGLASVLGVLHLADHAAGDERVTLDAFRWESRVLLLPVRDELSLGSDWDPHADALADRDLVVFRRSGDELVKVFPKTEERVSLVLASGWKRHSTGAVTLIGKDGAIKQQWNEESAEVPGEVFARIDAMPMRQVEMRHGRTRARDLIGTKVSDWVVGPEWAGSKPLRLADLRGRVVVVRFWTDTCPFCARSLPAIQGLAEEFATERVTFVGLYQSKPKGSERPWSDAVTFARKLGITFPLAYDHDWKTLRAWWLDGRSPSATSATFVIGSDGTIVHVHPGPVFFPSDDPEDSRANADYQAVRAAIRKHLPPK